jgi:hypothetical protein
VDSLGFIAFMKNNIIFLFLLFSIPKLFSQKEDFQWLLGGAGKITTPKYQTTMFDFNFTPYLMSNFGVNVKFEASVSTLCDSTGKLKAIANGNTIYNGNFEIIEDAINFTDDSPDAWPLPQCNVLLDYPGHPNQIAYISGEQKYYYDNLGTWLKNINFSVVDLSLNNGAGKVILKEEHIVEDTLDIGDWTACRHANGRDWWIIVAHFREQKYYTLLLGPSGLSLHHIQYIGKSENGLGQAVFSPDGNWYASYNVPGDIGVNDRSIIDLYRFDRCTGLLSDYQTKNYGIAQHGRPGGVAFSENSKYLYAANWDKIFQFNMDSTDVLATQKTVAVYDGFTESVFGSAQRFFHLLLAPDSRIYFSVSNYNSRYLHVIDKPNLADTACHVMQHSIYMPNYNNYTIPSIPYHRLYAQTGSPCDSLTVAVNDVSWRKINTNMYPNPAISNVTLSLPSGGLPSQGSLCLYDGTGRKVLKTGIPAKQDQVNFRVDGLVAGIYWYVVELYGRGLARGKLVVVD